MMRLQTAVKATTIGKRFKAPGGASACVSAAAKMVSVAALGLFLTACAATLPPAPSSTTATTGPAPTAQEPEIVAQENPNFATLPSLAGQDVVRVGLLLPYGSNNAGVAEVGQALLDAAMLAMFEIGNDKLVLIPKNTNGTPEGAELAAFEAIEEGAEIILGPLFAPSVRTVKPVAQARNVPVIAFSTDRTVGGDGVYLLSFLPEEEVRRITEFARAQGLNRFAALVPETAYGERVRQAFSVAIAEQGGELASIASYPRPRSAQELTRGLSEPAQSVARANDADSYDAILLPEGGTYLQIVAPFLPKYDVDPRRVKLLGTGLWDEPGLGKESTLVGGWFAAPAPAMRNAFQQKFRAAYNREPIRIASLSFDAVALVASLGQLPPETRFSAQTLSNPNGFAGIDGIFRFKPDGTAERGLAVMQVLPNRFEVVSPAPSSFEAIDSVRRPPATQPVGQPASQAGAQPNAGASVVPPSTGAVLPRTRTGVNSLGITVPGL